MWVGKQFMERVGLTPGTPVELTWRKPRELVIRIIERSGASEEWMRKAPSPKPEPPKPAGLTAYITPEAFQLTIPLSSVEDIDYAISTLQYLRRRILEAQQRKARA